MRAFGDLVERAAFPRGLRGARDRARRRRRRASASSMPSGSHSTNVAPSSARSGRTCSRWFRLDQDARAHARGLGQLLHQASRRLRVMQAPTESAIPAEAPGTTRAASTPSSSASRSPLRSSELRHRGERAVHGVDGVAHGGGEHRAAEVGVDAGGVDHRPHAQMLVDLRRARSIARLFNNPDPTRISRTGARRRASLAPLLALRAASPARRAPRRRRVSSLKWCSENRVAPKRGETITPASFSLSGDLLAVAPGVSRGHDPAAVGVVARRQHESRRVPSSPSASRAASAWSCASTLSTPSSFT